MQRRPADAPPLWRNVAIVGGLRVSTKKHAETTQAIPPIKRAMQTVAGTPHTGPQRSFSVSIPRMHRVPCSAPHRRKVPQLGDTPRFSVAGGLRGCGSSVGCQMSTL